MYEFVYSLLPSSTAIIAACCLLLGVFVGFLLCSMLVVGSRTDYAMEHEAAYLQALKQHGAPVAWRFRICDGAKWIYTDEERRVQLVPDHWQLQSLALITNVTAIE